LQFVDIYTYKIKIGVQILCEWVFCRGEGEAGGGLLYLLIVSCHVHLRGGQGYYTGGYCGSQMQLDERNTAQTGRHAYLYSFLQNLSISTHQARLLCRDNSPYGWGGKLSPSAIVTNTKRSSVSLWRKIIRVRWLAP